MVDVTSSFLLRLFVKDRNVNRLYCDAFLASAPRSVGECGMTDCRAG